jgi:hypothetical protein
MASFIAQKRFRGQEHARTEVYEQDENNKLQHLLLRCRQHIWQSHTVCLMNEAVGATRDGNRLKYELEEQLINGAGADAADAVGQVVLEPAVARAKA